MNDTAHVKRALHARSVQTFEQRKLILSQLRNHVDAKTTIGELDALRHAGENIGNPIVFLTLVEPWFRRMLDKESR